MFKGKNGHWALYAKSVLDRTRLALATKAEWYQQVLQPSADYLGSLLNVDQWAVRFYYSSSFKHKSSFQIMSRDLFFHLQLSRGACLIILSLLSFVAA